MRVKMNISKGERHKRKEDIKALWLQGTTTANIAQSLGITPITVNKEITKLESFYQKMAQNHPLIAKAQFARINKLLEEVEIIKNEFWTIYNDLKTKEQISLKLFEETSKKYEEEKAAGIEEKNRTDIIYPKDLLFNKITTLKFLLLRIEKETHLLGLYIPKVDITQNITINDVKSILTVMRDLLNEFVPPDRRNEAMQKLMNVKIQNEPVEAEIVKENGK